MQQLEDMAILKAQYWYDFICKDSYNGFAKVLQTREEREGEGGRGCGQQMLDIASETVWQVFILVSPSFTTLGSL